ncbi:MAG: hypothetical protein JW712_04145 [Dehalococcoidales bacterium]|nr:hypothetical protein [Dehalococcoidales bacterium]
MKNTLKIALVQMFSEKGEIRQNLAETQRHIEEAEKRGIDIIGFPEAGISGYIEPDRYPHAVITLDGSEVAEFVKMTEGKHLTALTGIIEKNPDDPRPYVTQVVARNGKLIGYVRKMNNVDEDAEWFSSGKEYKVFRHDDLIFGMAICADIELVRLFEECSKMGAKAMFELAAPGLYGDQETRNWQGGYQWWEGVCRDKLSAYAKKYGLWVTVATQAGRTRDEDFPGGGYLFNPRGERVYATNDWNPGVVYLEINLETGEVTELG